MVKQYIISLLLWVSAGNAEWSKRKKKLGGVHVVVVAVSAIVPAVATVPSGAVITVASACAVGVAVAVVVIVAVVVAITVVVVVVAAPVTVPCAAIVSFSLLSAELKLLLQLLYHHLVLLHLRAQFRQTLWQVLNGALHGRVVPRQILDDAVELLVCGVRCIHNVFHATLQIARNLAGFQSQ